MTARRLLGIGVAAGCAVAVGLTGLAVAAGSSVASTPDIGPDSVEFEAVRSEFVALDDGRKGSSVGDRFAFSEDVSYWNGDRTIGTNGVDCVVTHVPPRKPADAVARPGPTTQECT